VPCKRMHASSLYPPTRQPHHPHPINRTAQAGGLLQSAATAGDGSAVMQVATGGVKKGK